MSKISDLQAQLPSDYQVTKTEASPLGFKPMPRVLETGTLASAHRTTASSGISHAAEMEGKFHAAIKSAKLPGPFLSDWLRQRF